MPTGKARHAIGVHVIPIRPDGKILLGLRSGNVQLAPGKWSTTCGTLEANETAPYGAAREALEELGVTIDPDDLRFAHAAHFTNDEGHGPALAIFFTTHVWSGIPMIREPDKCEAFDWFDINVLPQPIVPYVAHALTHIQCGIATNSLDTGFSTLGWPETGVIGAPATAAKEDAAGL